MSQEIISFSRFVDSCEDLENFLDETMKYLMDIFECEAAYFHKGYIRVKHHGLYLPVSVEGKNIGYYEVVGGKKKISDYEFNIVISLLSQLHTKIRAYTELSIKNHYNLVHNANYIDIYKNNLNPDNLINLNCLLINIYNYESVVNLYGLEVANNMMKIVSNMVKMIFNLPNDTIFRYDNNKIIIFIANKTIASISNRANELGYVLNGNNIAINFGVSSTRDNFDLGNLVFQAEKNMDLSMNMSRKYY